MEKNRRVRVKKIAASSEPKYKTPKFDDYETGVHGNQMSVPIEYEVEGRLVIDVEEQGFIYISRDARNGVEADGLFRSSIIQTIKGNIVETCNSRYIVEEIC